MLAAIGLLGAVHRTALALAASVRESLAAGRERELVDDVREALEAGELLTCTSSLLVDAARAPSAAPRRCCAGKRPCAPDEFPPAVECSPLIGPADGLGARPRARRLPRAGAGCPSRVNVATANLAEPDLPVRVLAALRRYGRRPRH